jgi:hypothetical protein
VAILPDMFLPQGGAAASDVLHVESRSHMQSASDIMYNIYSFVRAGIVHVLGKVQIECC